MAFISEILATKIHTYHLFCAAFFAEKKKRIEVNKMAYRPHVGRIFHATSGRAGPSVR
jgi:phosphoribosylaminoimidazole carboxylase (NCAIR synthetase)